MTLDRELLLQRKRNYERLRRKPDSDGLYWMAHAFAERFGVSILTVRKIGTDRLCHCLCDEARRLLLKDWRHVYEGFSRNTLRRKQGAKGR